MNSILYLAVCVLFSELNANPIEYDSVKTINLSERIRNVRQLNETLGINIIGGEEAVTGEIPYIVSIRYTGSNHFCGGTIVSSRSIVTAAHCVIGDSPNDLLIRYNTLTYGSGGILVQVSQLFYHENYDSASIDNDIAVLNLQSALDLTLENAKAVQLPVQDQDPPASAEVTVSGWGRTQESVPTLSTNLLKIVVPIVSREECGSLYKTPVIDWDITENMICAGDIEAGGKDACQNDSGGPLVHDNVLWGATSFGYGCARPLFPGVYTRVGKFVNWIEQRIIS